MDVVDQPLFGTPESAPQPAPTPVQGATAEPATSDPSLVDDPGRPGWFDLALLAPPARRALTSLAQATPPVLIALVSELETLASAAAQLLAERWTADPTVPDAVLSDLRVITPTGDRWTVEEIETQLFAVVRRAPAVRHVIVIDAADRMDARLADRLLRTLEEPPSPTTFVLCVEDLASLAPTVQGRVEQIVEILPAAPTERAEALAAAGVARPAAETAVRLAGRAVTLAPLLAADAELASLASRFLDHPAWDASTAPVGDAVELAELAGRLAASWERGALVAKAPEKPSPSEKARTRAVIRMGFDRHRSSSRALLRRVAASAQSPVFAATQAVTPGTGSFVATVELRLAALADAERQLRAFSSPRLVLAALFASSGTPAPVTVEP
jgi:hypothetical protein